MTYKRGERGAQILGILNAKIGQATDMFILCISVCDWTLFLINYLKRGKGVSAHRAISVFCVCFDRAKASSKEYVERFIFTDYAE